MILQSTTETVPFTPPWLCEADGVTPKPGAPVFHLRAGSVIERGQMEAELSGAYRAGLVGPFELIAAIREGLTTLLAGDPELDHLLSLVDAEAQGEAASLSAADTKLLDGARKILAEHWPDYAELLAQSERRRSLAPLVALRRFCVGIDAEGVSFARDRFGAVADETLKPFDQLTLAVAGARAFNLQYPSAEKNSPSPSASDSAQPTSGSGGGSKGAGSSKAKGSRKTRA